MYLGVALLIFIISVFLFLNQRRIERRSRSSMLVVQENNKRVHIPVHETVYSIKRPWGGHGLLANPFQK